MKLNVDWLTKQDMVKGIKYLAGERGGSNTISGINIMDNPDTVRWLKKDEMVLSTGYLFVSTGIASHIIRDLYEQGCSALGIKMNRYLDRLPEEMTSQADELDFPIVSIPFDSTMEEIVNIVYRQMFEDEMSATQRIVSAYKDVLMAATRSNRLDEMTKSISAVVESSVFLTNEHFEVIEYYIPEGSELKFPFPFSHDSSTLFSEKDIAELKKNDKGAVLPVRKLIKPLGEKTVTLLVFPVANKKAVLGRIVCAVENHEFTSLDYDFMQTINSVVYLALVSNNLLSEEQRSNDEQFYRELLLGNVMNKSELERLCLSNGFNYSSNMICIAFLSAGYERLTVAKKRTVERIMKNSCCECLDEENIKYNMTFFDGRLLVFVYCQADGQNNAAADMKKLAGRMSSALSDHKINCITGISRIGKGALNVAELYSQAVGALRIGAKLHPDNTIFSYQDDLMVHNLYNTMSMPGIRALYDEYVLPLIQHDEKYSGELFHTAEVFFDCGLNMTAAAKKLFIHRNTMMYRIKQIEEIIGAELSDGDTLYRMQTGMYIKKIIDMEMHQDSGRL